MDIKVGDIKRVCYDSVFINRRTRREDIGYITRVDPLGIGFVNLEGMERYALKENIHSISDEEISDWKRLRIEDVIKSIERVKVIEAEAEKYSAIWHRLETQKKEEEQKLNFMIELLKRKGY